MSLKKKQLLDRIIKATYMGFLLDDECNEYLGIKVILDDNNMFNFINNYNKNVSQYKINLTLNKYGLQIRTLGEVLFLNNEEILKLKSKIEKKINFNIHLVMEKSSKSIEMYDLELLYPLELQGITTMGNKYKAYNGNKYTVHFLHLYSIIKGY